MQIIYGYSNCTNKKYAQIISERNVAVLQPDQKYHSLLIKGLAKNCDTVRCFSGLPINRAVTSKKFINEKDETEENITYHYYKTFNFPILRQIMIFFGAFFNTLKFKNKSTFCICDILNIANVYGMMLACKIKRIPITMIVTDLPDMLGGNKINIKLNNYLFKRADSFIFLTEQMNDYVNKKHKPYIVLEGHVDADEQHVKTENTDEEEIGEKKIIYAGSLLKLYGIQNLVEGFIKADIDASRLIIFGDGDYKDELTELCKTQKNIEYLGVKPNKEVVEAQKRAALLVNPRPTNEEYTKYSFPSKNMEYMVSGTPVLTTRLPGMPKEYYDYVYLIEDETADGITDALKKVFKDNIKQRKAKGRSARDFVLENKSNTVQAAKIVKFLKEM